MYQPHRILSQRVTAILAVCLSSGCLTAVQAQQPPSPSELAACTGLHAAAHGVNLRQSGPLLKAGVLPVDGHLGDGSQSHQQTLRDLAQARTGPVITDSPGRTTRHPTKARAYRALLGTVGQAGARQIGLQGFQPGVQTHQFVVQGPPGIGQHPGGLVG